MRALIKRFALMTGAAAFIGIMAASNFFPIVLGGDNTGKGSYLAAIDVILPLIERARIIDSADAQGFNIPAGSRLIGHMLAGPNTTSPTVNSGTVTPGSSNSFGQLTAGGATATLTFSTAWTNTPWCMIVDPTTPSTGLKYTVSTTAITITGGLTTSDKVNWMCIGP